MIDILKKRKYLVLALLISIFGFLLTKIFIYKIIYFIIMFYGGFTLANLLDKFTEEKKEKEKEIQ